MKKTILSSIFLLSIISCGHNNYHPLSTKYILSFNRPGQELYSIIKIEGSPKHINNVDYDGDLFLKKDNVDQLFPSTINCGEIDFFFFEQSGKKEAFLKWNISDIGFFDNEIARIKNITCEKKIRHTSTLFCLPAYVAAYNFNSLFEYSLYDYVNLTIYYIYLYDIGDFNQIVFDYKYAPTRYIQTSDFPFEKDEISWYQNGVFSIYR